MIFTTHILMFSTFCIGAIILLLIGFVLIMRDIISAHNKDGPHTKFLSVVPLMIPWEILGWIVVGLFIIGIIIAILFVIWSVQEHAKKNR